MGEEWPQNTPTRGRASVQQSQPEQKSESASILQMFPCLKTSGEGGTGSSSRRRGLQKKAQKERAQEEQGDQPRARSKTKEGAEVAALRSFVTALALHDACVDVTGRMDGLALCRRAGLAIRVSRH